MTWWSYFNYAFFTVLHRENDLTRAAASAQEEEKDQITAEAADEDEEKEMEHVTAEAVIAASTDAGETFVPPFSRIVSHQKCII